MKQLSIAVPSYNMEKLLPRCLDSMADERLRGDIEVLVVDDGSKDNTAQIADEYAQKWPDIFTVIRKENGGHGSAVNAALDRATGRYFRIVDADDWVNTENLILLTGRMKETDVDLILDEKTEVDMMTGREQYFPFPEEMPSDGEVPFEEIAAHKFRYHLALHTMSVKRRLLVERHIRLLEHTFYVDSQYVTEATAFIRDALVLRMGIYYYQVGNAAQSVHYLNYVKRYEEHDRVVNACLEFLRRAEFEKDRAEFAAHSVELLIHTQYNIALIYNPDRKQGRAQALRLREKLIKEYPEQARTTEQRFKTGMLLNRLGIGYEGLNRIKKLMKRG